MSKRSYSASSAIAIVSYKEIQEAEKNKVSISTFACIRNYIYLLCSCETESQRQSSSTNDSPEVQRIECDHHSFAGFPQIISPQLPGSVYAPLPGGGTERCFQGNTGWLQACPASVFCVLLHRFCQDPSKVRYLTVFFLFFTHQLFPRDEDAEKNKNTDIVAAHYSIIKECIALLFQFHLDNPWDTTIKPIFEMLVKKLVYICEEGREDQRDSSHMEVSCSFCNDSTMPSAPPIPITRPQYVRPTLHNKNDNNDNNDNTITTSATEQVDIMYGIRFKQLNNNTDNDSDNNNTSTKTTTSTSSTPSPTRNSEGGSDSE
jgi:hypothetical protein